jgi:hypothetical protein
MTQRNADFRHSVLVHLLPQKFTQKTLRNEISKYRINCSAIRTVAHHHTVDTLHIPYIGVQSVKSLVFSALRILRKYKCTYRLNN